MQDQGKRLLLAVALALGVMLLWNVIFPSKKADPPKPAPAGQQLVKQSSHVGVSLEHPVSARSSLGAQSATTSCH